MEIFKNEYEFNSLYINDLNREEIHLFVDNLNEVGKGTALDFRKLFFDLLKNVLFYCKEFKVSKPKT